MVAVPDMCADPVSMAGPAELAVASVCRRVVAIAETTMELLRPESDLLRVVTDIGQVDLLVVALDAPIPDVPEPTARLTVVAAAPSDAAPSDAAPSDVDLADVDWSDVEPEDDDEGDAGREGVAAEVARLGLPGLQVHHLELRPPLTAGAEPDLVAALSELVGFDPEPGVYCLAPEASDGARGVIAAAAQRIARIYGIPLLRYRCLELAVVPGPRAADE